MADKSEKQAEATSRQAKEAVEQETEQGFRGSVGDETPNENYTVSGVTSGAETPETRAADERTGKREGS